MLYNSNKYIIACEDKQERLDHIVYVEKLNIACKDIRNELEGKPNLLEGN